VLCLLESISAKALKTKEKTMTRPETRCGAFRTDTQQVAISSVLGPNSGAKPCGNPANEAVEALSRILVRLHGMMLECQVLQQQVVKLRLAVVRLIAPSTPTRTTERARRRGPLRLKGDPSTLGVRDHGNAGGKTVERRKILTGIFDNRSTWQRESWVKGNCTSFIHMRELVQAAAVDRSSLTGKPLLPEAWRKPWGYYPDVKGGGK